MVQKAPEFHKSVLGPEVSIWLITDPAGFYVDATVGGGGHAECLLEKLNERGRLVGIDQDPKAVHEAKRRLSRFGDRAVVIKGTFWELKQIIGRFPNKVSGLLFDLGVSSHQIDDPQRGFSYRQDGPLDMRMSPSALWSAKEIVNTYSQEALTEVFKRYGEERASAKIARKICIFREKNPLIRTMDLANLIARQVKGPHIQKSLARIFQALRIEVNRELVYLKTSLENAVEVLQEGGRVAVLSYHSLEDRIVKQVFRSAVLGCICPPDLPICGCGKVKTLKVLTPRGVRTGKVEQISNPRSRSATLRVAEKIKIQTDIPKE